VNCGVFGGCVFLGGLGLGFVASCVSHCFVCMLFPLVFLRAGSFPLIDIFVLGF